MYNINQINKAIKTYVDNEMIPSLPQLMKIVLSTYVDSMQLSKEQFNEILSNPIVKPLNIEQNGMYDVDKLLDNFEKNVQKYGPIEIKISKIGIIPLGDEKIFRFNHEDINKLKTYLKQQQ